MPPAPFRRAIVLLVPAPMRERLDEIRRRWDPVMCGRIGTHITLIHDVNDHDRASVAVAEAAASTSPFVVRLGRADRWGPSAWGIYLHIDDLTGGVASLHSQLASLEETRWARATFRAHVTLVHSRTTEPAIAEEAWAELDGFDPGWDVEIGAIDVVELDDAVGWSTVERFELAFGTVPP
jgi:2'-5' RNA ligase